jgi:aromatic-L-amino-acid decarboxylase
MAPDEFRRHAHALVEWIATYLSTGDYPVMSRVEPGDIRDALPSVPPESGTPFDQIMADFETVLLPGITHWNHPGFFAYFAISGSAPGVLGEFLTAALNVQAMLWKTSPAATELEEVALGWLRQLLGLPAAFEAVIYDTASVASLHALAAAREVAVPDVRARGLAGRNVAPLSIYVSEQAHSSIEKAAITLGLGLEAVRKIPTDDRFRMRTTELAQAITEDRSAGRQPMAVVATVGTTSTTSVDPVPEIADICADEGLWLHVDAAYAGAAALVTETASVLDGCERADSLVVNPHKWLFTPFDLSAFYCRRMDMVRATFALTPEYLTSREAGVTNLMDTGIQLGRRFRAMKLWCVLRYFGASGIRARLSEHMRLARLFAEWVDDSSDFERLAPVPLSVVCFRARPGGTEEAESDLDELNARLLDSVNASGTVFLSHTRLRGKFTIRLAVGHIRTTEHHVRLAWDTLNEALRALS